MRHGLWTSLSRIAIAATAVMILQTGFSSAILSAQDSEQEPKKTKEPVFRVSKLNEPGKSRVSREVDTAEVKNESPRNVEGDRVADSGAIMNAAPAAALPAAALPAPAVPAKTVAAPTTRAPHPLDRAVNLAEDALEKMQSEIYDYTAILAKREQINGVVGSPGFMSVKVRCPRTLANGTKVPFSIYMKFLKPKEAAGREVIWTEGQNEGKLIAHEGSGLLSLRRFYLDPTGFLAMKGQRYPIYDAGVENLIVKLIEKAERDRAAGPCEVNYREGAEINKCSCSMIELIHHDRQPEFEFHKAQVFLDDKLQIPVRYAAYDWPDTPGGDPKLIEEYTYYNVKVNVGLTDADFSPENKKYKFPKR